MKKAPRCQTNVYSTSGSLSSFFLQGHRHNKLPAANLQDHVFAILCNYPDMWRSLLHCVLLGSLFLAQEADDVARVSEAVTKAVVSAIKSAPSDDNTDDWLNPTEVANKYFLQSIQ